MTPLPFADLEQVYERLAAAIDAVGPERESLFLAKLALALAHELGDRDAALACIEKARQDLDETPSR